MAILGSTGSIGRQALEVLTEAPGPAVRALAARNNWRQVAEQARAVEVSHVAIVEQEHHENLRAALGQDVQLYSGDEAMVALLEAARPDVVLSAVVGAAGLAPTLKAIELGATIALANKETLVCAGGLVMPAAVEAGVPMLPVDSEHSGIFQCLLAGRHEEIRRVIITSSGGALRDFDDQAAAEATVEEALSHPTWSMGPKVTIDSATLMNKALEIIEAHWLFDLPAEKIEVLIHPQSIVHAMVEFMDGSTMAQLAEPDMKGPIAYALHYPRRPAWNVRPLNLAEIGTLEFRAVAGRFARPVELAWRAIREGGCSGAVLNAANETAVELFLAGRIRFGRIVDLVEDAMDRWAEQSDRSANSSERPTVQDILHADAWARAVTAEQAEPVRPE